MKALFLTTLSMFLFCSFAQAQEITIEAACNLLSPADPKGAAYQPDVDANGNAVVSADLVGTIPAIAYPLVIPVEIDTLRLLDSDIADNYVSTGGNLETDLAYVTMFEDGRIEYNGKDISSNTIVDCKNEPIPEGWIPPRKPKPIVNKTVPAQKKIIEAVPKKDDIKPEIIIKESVDETISLKPQTFNTDFKKLLSDLTAQPKTTKELEPNKDE